MKRADRSSRCRCALKSATSSANPATWYSYASLRCTIVHNLCVRCCCSCGPCTQAERDRAEEREQEQLRLCETERDKRLVAESDLESERAKTEQLRREGEHAVARAVSKLQEDLRREISQTVDNVCHSTRRDSSKGRSSAAARSSVHSDVKRPRMDDSFRSSGIPSRKASAAPVASPGAAAGGGFSTVPETLNQSDSLGLS